MSDLMEKRIEDLEQRVLRLQRCVSDLEPSRFQTERKECECACHTPKGLPLEHSCCPEAVSHSAKPSAVESLMKQLADKYCIGKSSHGDPDNVCSMELELYTFRNLVRSQTIDELNNLTTVHKSSSGGRKKGK